MRSVCICGSRRFKKEIRAFAAALRKRGVIVHTPFLHSATPEEWDALSDDQKQFVMLGLTHDHFYRIQMADVIFIFNQDGYVGNSTTLEIGFAIALGKPVYAFSDQDDEMCRDVFYRDYVQTPEELLALL